MYPAVMVKKPRGWWNTSFRDHARAQLQADELAQALQAQQPTQDALQAEYRRGWHDGREALLKELAVERQQRS